MRTMSITVDGHTYAGVDEMPPHVRQKYERLVGRLLVDQDGNGIPDVFESGTVDGAEVVHVTQSLTHTYDVNGQTYRSLDEVPPPFRRLIDGLHARGAHEPHDDPSAPLPYQSRRTFEAGRPSGLHIHLTWGTFAWLVSGLALATWIGYVLWER